MKTKSKPNKKNVKSQKTSGYNPDLLRFKPLRVVAPVKKNGRWSCIKSKSLKVSTREYYRLYMELKRKAQGLLVAPKPHKSSPKQSPSVKKTKKVAKPVQVPTRKPKTTKKVVPVVKPWSLWLKCSDDLGDWPKKVVKAFQTYLVPANVKDMTRAEHRHYLEFMLGKEIV